MTQKLTIVVTGASGLLGRAVVGQLKSRGHAVFGTALTRAKDGLQKLDLTDFAAMEEFLKKVAPQVVVHCAAERRPDACQSDHEGVLKLNAEVPRALARLCRAADALLIYISTDYIFDGKNPPYETDAKPNPLNFYGVSKLRGEEAIMEEAKEGAKTVSLRVPVLYGEAETPSESAVNVLLKAVQSLDPIEMDHYAIRYPTNVADVARVIADLSEKQCIENVDVTGIRQFSAPEKMTKYDMCKVYGELLGAPITHLKPVSSEPVSATANRPYDCHLSTKSLEELGINCGCISFKKWWAAKLSKGVKQ